MTEKKGIWYKIQQQLRWKSIEFKSHITAASEFYQTSPGRRHLLYHGIDHHGRTDLNSRFISEFTFERHLQWLKKYCHVVPLSEYLNGALHPEKLTVTISFDDGYKNNFSIAFPLLEKYQIPATFFVTASVSQGQTVRWFDLLDIGRLNRIGCLDFYGERYQNKGRKGFIGEKSQRNLKTVLRESDLPAIQEFLSCNRQLFKLLELPEWNIYWELMSQEEIAAASKSKFITVGSHGASHLSLNHIAENSVLNELISSKNWLEQITGKTIDSFSFPYGDYSPKIAQVVSKCGYKNICCMEYRYGERSNSLGYLNRMGINPYINFHVQVAEIKRGSYD